MLLNAVHERKTVIAYQHIKCLNQPYTKRVSWINHELWSECEWFWRRSYMNSWNEIPPGWWNAAIFLRILFPLFVLLEAVFLQTNFLIPRIWFGHQTHGLEFFELFCQILLHLCITTGNCGRPQIAASRVIAGKDAVRGSWPWQILMLYNSVPICGGTLVNPTTVVTAAHCVSGREGLVSSFKVRYVS